MSRYIRPSDVADVYLWSQLASVDVDASSYPSGVAGFLSISASDLYQGYAFDPLDPGVERESISDLASFMNQSNNRALVPIRDVFCVHQGTVLQELASVHHHSFAPGDLPFFRRNWQGFGLLINPEPYAGHLPEFSFRGTAGANFYRGGPTEVRVAFGECSLVRESAGLAQYQFVGATSGF